MGLAAGGSRRKGMGFEVGTQEISDTAGFERAGGLEVLEFEKDAAVLLLSC